MNKVELSILRQKIAGTWIRNQKIRWLKANGYPLAYIGRLFPKKDGTPLSRQRIWSIDRAPSCGEKAPNQKQGRFRTFVGNCIRRIKKLRRIR